MPAIPYRKTATSDAAWDGPANKARLGQNEADLRGAFAWVDPDKDPTTKEAFKGIHHEVGEDGKPGAANLTACSAVIAELNGGRGGFDVPDGDRAGIHAHVAHHLEDAGRDAPELKSARRSFAQGVRTPTASERITRMVPGEIEVRATSTGTPLIRGYAAVFDASTEINDWFGSYLETVGRGCFTKTISDGADVRCLYNHDPNYVLARTKSGTLQLSEDSHGLSYEATPPDTQWARDLCETMRRGDVDGSSFGFRVVRERWGSAPDPDGDGDSDMMDCRTLLEVQLYDVSPVTYPAYPQADSSVRAALSGAGFDLDALARIVIRGHRGMTLVNRDRDAIRAAIDYLTRYLPNEPKASPVAPVLSGHTTPATPAEPTLPSHSAQKALERFARLNRAIAEDRPERLKALRAAT